MAFLLDNTCFTSHLWFDLVLDFFLLIKDIIMGADILIPIYAVFCEPEFSLGEQQAINKSFFRGLLMALGTGQPQGGMLGFHCCAWLLCEQVIQEKQARS